MRLVKENTVKRRVVYEDHRYFKKYWLDKSFEWVINHVKILDIVMPNYVQGFGHDGTGVYILFSKLPGIPADTFEHTPQFCSRIYQYCRALNERTQPYYHGDWVLSNILIDGDNIYMCDWDNVGKHSINDVNEKMYADLESAFGTLFEEIYDDAASI